MTSVPNPSLAATSPAPSTLERLQRQFSDDPVLNVIQQQMPTAFSDASAQQLQDYRRALRVSRHARAELKKLLKPLQGLSEFAEPLLRQALDQRFGPGLAPKTDTLFHPWLTPAGATGGATQLTLLEAALHNFERKESAAGGFLPGAAITKGIDGPHSKNIQPEQFADLCRHVNLGQKYQDHLHDVLEPASAPGDAANAARLNAQATFILNDQADMELYARAAFLRKDISEPALAAVVSLVRPSQQPQFDGLPVAFESVNLLGFEIPRVVLIKPMATWTFTQVPLVLYVPQDPIRPFQQFASLSEVEDELRARLMNKSYQTFFAQLIGERNRAQFFNQLNRRMFPLAPQDSNWFTRGLWHRTPNARADLRLETDPIDTNLFKRMHGQQIGLIKDNARFLAVPTEDEDAKSRRERLQAWLDIGMNVANVASFMVPALGQLMMVYATVELVGEVYHGLEDISHGDFEEGFDHLADAAANIAFMAALAKAAGTVQLAEPPPLKSNHFVGQVIPIKLDNGQMRLWKPDLEPFQTTVKLPADATPDVEGIHDVDGKKYLNIDDTRYEVQYSEALNKWQIKHPDPRHLFSPELQHNGAGAFRLAGEHPERWARTQLFRRLGHSVSGLSDTVAEQILAVSGVDEALLRKVHLQNVVEPGQFRDTIARFRLDAELDSFVVQPGNTRALEFGRRYAARQASSDLAVQRLQRDFPTLPMAVADDLVAMSQASEIQQMIESGRVPLRLAEAAAWHIRQTRLNRALEGFYLESVVNPDTETLSLRLLEKLPGWSDQVRLEVRRGSTHGPLLESIGNPQARELKTLVKSNGRYQAFDGQGNELNGLPQTGNNLCDSVLHALPDAARKSVGFAHVGHGSELNAALATLATADRQQAALILGQSRARLRFNAPSRLENGRIGYVLSGRGRLSPDILDDHLLDRIGLLELRDTTPQQVLEQMRAEGWMPFDISARLEVMLDERQALRTSLDRWVQASSHLLNPGEERLASRMRIGEAILDHWQATSLPGASDTPALHLHAVGLDDFPADLPTFFYSRVQRLELTNTVSHVGAPDAWEPGTPIFPDVIDAFLGLFPETTALDIRRFTSAEGMFPGFSGLAQTVAARLPHLRTLSLVNQGIELGSALEVFGNLPDLHTLDISGNYFLRPPARDLINPSLRRLALDNTNLWHWPDWLTGLIPEQLDELSLANNRIDHLPDDILIRSATSARTTSISLQGNRLSRDAMTEASLRGASDGHPLRFNLGIPPELESRVDVLRAEQSQLQEAINDWVRASGSRSAPTEAVIDARRRLGEALMEHWRRSVVRRHALPVILENIALSDFPRLLPDTFYQNVAGLQLLNAVGDGQQLNDFLARFQSLNSLEIVGPSLQLSAPPRVLRDLPNLTELSLVNQGMLIDQAAIEYLSSLSSVRHLDLSGNSLGHIQYSPAMDRHWQSLDLNNVGITEWPEWLSEFMPGGISALSLANNGLTELPSEILRNRRSSGRHTELSLEGNPLSELTMVRAHVGDRDNFRSFSFFMDLPEDIREMEQGPADSSSDSEDGSGSDTDSSDEGSTNDFAWLNGTAEQQAALARVEAAGDAPMLVSLVGQLPQTSDYNTARADLTARVWRLLEAADSDADLRRNLNVIAADPITGHTCGDGVRLQFSQMEVHVFAQQALGSVSEAERGRVLYQRMRGLYRLETVDRLAIENSGDRDQAEVRLAYQLGLAEQLELPLTPSSMLFSRLAAVSPEELLSAQQQVLNGENGPAFRLSAMDRDEWVTWLEENNRGAFAQLEETFAVERDRLEEEFPGLGDAYDARAAAILAEHQDRRRALMDWLTYQEGLKYND